MRRERGRLTALGHRVEAGGVGMRRGALIHVALNALLGLNSALAAKRDPFSPESNSGDGENDGGENSSADESGADL